MIFFNGFLLKNEEKFFSSILDTSHFSVAGFSYGSILALEYVLKNLETSQKRIDKLQLFSPAFFDISDKKFVRTQLFYFAKERENYQQTFINNVFYPKKLEDFEVEFKENDKKDLEKLLTFDWESQAENLEKIAKSGIKIESYFGEKDKIIDSLKAFEFFKKYSQACFFKEKGHILI